MKTKTDSWPDRWRTRRAGGPGWSAGGGRGRRGRGKARGALDRGCARGRGDRGAPRQTETGTWSKGPRVFGSTEGACAFPWAPCRYTPPLPRDARGGLYVSRSSALATPSPSLQSLRLVLPLLVPPPFSAAWHSARELSADTLYAARARAHLPPLPSPPPLPRPSLSLSPSLEAISPRSRLGLSSRVSPGFCTVVSAPSDAGEPRGRASYAGTFAELARAAIDLSNEPETSPRRFERSADVSFTFIAFLHYGGS